ncbi:T9SS type B sorting domain-containing protein [Tenacibaculum finnmarkense]|uniref:T9SS type B sorting domain-containing protein n=1 Tax=Tenacibaculum finnmarkense TaxID=2781243 RepID=UPI001EFA4310|nr:T9SS type B sorting domain-containing protein [Tenacibaculum finnmarkense]MCG8207033.1 T9SS type B sorting domain-containing protein [Tenacibaculum finnmarkense genomovar finnmarkense]MCG8723215.1 T9SS type B sorting domain-containing protein [Tenacibaculum finnmarkense]MCG8764826.1 T9SS type B sorting domain-containing protein [Tenacibaculum finnmarkense]MCG8777747.1 T9SS type B sorting domain-containing protein [Tenacibaculum finnmarkense]MCM8906145.1 T9SS type B sorting domain-containing
MIKKILLLASLFFTLISFSQKIDASLEHLRENKSVMMERAMPLPLGQRPSGFTQSDINKNSAEKDLTLRGNMTFIGNNNLSIDVGKTRDFRELNKAFDLYRYPYILNNGSVYTGNETPNDSYDLDLYIYQNGNIRQDLGNGSAYMDYVDVDGSVDENGDGKDDTFSSSTSTLSLPNCSRVAYAGLYWAGVYPREHWLTTTNPLRSDDYDKIKFKYPSSTTYKNITADETIYNNKEPYICFKDITTEVQAEANPNGVYTAANIRATRGVDHYRGLGGASGWVMIVVYENDNESSKKFSVFDGFANIRGEYTYTDTNGIDITVPANEAEIPFSGFKTIPKGPVNVELIMAALEGDKAIPGDGYQIKNAAGNYVNVFNTISPQDNFFNGSISVFDTYLAGRNPASTNTLGFDIDHIKINNPNNSIIGNNETSLDVKFTTGGDIYWPFLNAMSVEVVEPKIKLVKTITDASGGNISGTPVGLGSSLFYDLTFSSVGTDNAKNTVIIDELPKNVNLSLGDILPASIQLVATAPAYPNTNTDIVYTYEPPVSANGFRGKLRFYIPDSFVKIKGAEHSIKLKIEVVSDCSKLRDVCSDKIENQAYANYSRDLSALNVGDLGYTPGYNRIENTPSFSGIDACNLGQAGSSNFLIDTSGCTFERTEILCGKNILLAAGTGFTSYSWVNENAPLTVLGTSQTYNATQTGTYLVTKVAPTGCVTSTEKIIVIPYSTAPNPLILFADQISTSCASNNEKLAEIILCGGSRTINLPFTGATGTTVKWFKLDETCAFKAAKKCANLDTSCTWNEIGTTFSKEFSTKGQYKVEVFYDGKCPSTYYFNVFTSALSQTIVKKHIICGTDGSITVNDVSVDYEYQLTKPDGTTIPANGFQNGKAFTGLTAAGDYDVKIRLQGSPAGACHYTIPNINIQKQALGLTVDPEFNAGCDGKAIITAQVNGTLPGNYIYTLLNSVGGVIETKAATSDKSVTFEVTTAGLYSVKVATTTTTCTETVTTRVIKPTPLTLTAVATKNITCTAGSSDGIITLVGANGVPNATGDKYSYALLSINGAAVSPKTYFTDTTYNVVNGTEGDYIFEVTDSKNCTATATAKISVEAPLQFTHKETQVNCNKKGTITVDVTNNTGYKLEYSIDNATWKTTGFFDGLNATTAATLYTVYIRATKGTYQCNYQIQNIAITETGGLSAGSAVATGLECRWGNTQSSPIGTIAFTAPTGGTAPFTYFYKLAADTNFTSVTSGNTASVPVAGTYNTKVEDKNGCSLVLDTVTIDALPTEPTIKHEILICGNTATVIITPKDASYSYSIDGTNFQASNVFENVRQDWYKFSIKYGKSCTVKTPYVSLYGQPLTGSVTATTDSDCSGSDNGSITVNARNFQGGSYEYSTDGGNTWEETGDNPYRIVGLPKGNYDLKIRETIGTTPNQITCEKDLGKHSIGEPTELKLINTGITTPATCVTGATITVEATGGTAPYKFSIDKGVTWQDANSSNQYIYTGVAVSATKYQVMLLDSKKCDECGCTDNPFENGSFEDRYFRGYYPYIADESNFTGWETTAADNKMELWYKNNFEGVPSYDGSDNFVELNANTVGSLYQEFCTKPGDVINWSVAHRGRLGRDVATVKIGKSLASATIEKTMSDGKTWKEYSGAYTVPAGQTTTVISFDAVSTFTGDKSTGNFIDAVKIEIVRATCVLKDIEVTAAAAATHTATVTDSCTDPKIEITATGTAPYQFTIDNGATWQTSNNATFVFNTTNGLALPTTTAKDYQVKTKNGGGCESLVSTLTVYPKLTATVTPTPESCKKGFFTITDVKGGNITTTNYVYAIVLKDATPTNTDFKPITNPSTKSGGLSAENYDIYIRDNGGNAGFCELKIQRAITKTENPIVKITNATALDCTVNTKASISFEVSEGKAPFSYTVHDGTSTIKTGNITGNTATISGLTANTYKIIVTDANNCVSAEISEKIEALASLTGGSAVATNLKCSASGTIFGTITFTNPTTGTPGLAGNYTFYYKLTTDTAYNVATGNSKIGLPAGIYNTKVVDSKGCSLSFPDLTIDDLPTVLTTTKPVTYNCDGKGNVKVTVTTTRIPTATAPITYTLGADTNETGEFTNLQVGDHTVSVNYGSDCILPVIVEVKDNQKFTAVASFVENPKCKDGTDGKIKVVASFGSVAVNSFEYSTDGTTWIPVASNEVIIDTFGAGNHIIEVRQNLGGCEVDSNAIKLTAPTSAVIVDLSTKTLTKEITCNPNTGATITPTASGGNGTYTFELLDSAKASLGNTFTGLSAGTYSVVATDKLGCKSDPFEVIITDKKGVDFTATASVCHTGNDAEIQLTAITGNDTNFTFSVHDGTSIIKTGSITGIAHTISGLSAGTYKVTVTDGFGCSETEDVTINENLTISGTTTQASCKAGILDITASGGSGVNYVYAVVKNQVPAIVPTVFSTTKPTTITAGTWDIYVRDNGGTGTLGTDYCQAIFTTNKVTKIPDLKVETVTAIQPKCSTDKGIINVKVSGGKAAYTVTLTGLLATTPAQTKTGSVLSYKFENLVADTYTITVEDINTCTGTAASTQEIKVPSALTAGLAVPTDLACGVSGGSITFSGVSGGTPDYIYSYKLTGDATYTPLAIGATVISNLSAGTYDTKVSDAEGCTISLTQVTIKPLPAVPTFNPTAITYNCDGTATIQVTPTVAAATAYSYMLDKDKTTTNNTGVFTAVTPGSHTVSVDYGSNCSTDVIVEVKANQQFTASITGQTNPVCKDDANGKIEVTASFGSTIVSSFEYSTDGTTWITVNSNKVTIDGFNAGTTDITHTINVRPTGKTSPSACDVTLTKILTNPTEVKVTKATATQITCTSTTSTITPSASGGNGGTYTYTVESMDNLGNSLSPKVISSTLTGLSAGKYNVVAKDKLGCESIAFPITIAAKEDVEFTATASACHTGSDASITLDVTKGNGTYSFALTGTATKTGNITGTSHTIPNLSAGTYTVTVTDGFGCELEVKDITINEKITADIALKNETCNLGSLTISNATGGNVTIASGTNYVYAVVTENTTPISTDFSATTVYNLSADKYDVYVRDNNGNAGYCEFKISKEIIKIADLVATAKTIIQPNCFGETGSLVFEISGGKANYTYVLNDGTNDIIPAASSITVVGNTHTIADLYDGTYKITVTDANTCTATIPTQTIKAPDKLEKVGDATPIHFTCKTLKGGIDFVNPNGGTGVYTFSYKLETAPVTAFQPVLGNQHLGLDAGTYNIKVKDVNGCEIPLNDVTINPLPAAPTLTKSVAYNCDGKGTVTVLPFDASYTYSLDGATPQTGANPNVFADLDAGSYTVSVGYGSDCFTDIDVIVANDKKFGASVTKTVNPTCFGASDGSITIEAVNATLPYEYSIDGGTNWFTTNANPVTVSTLAEGTYDVKVRQNNTAPLCEVIVSTEKLDNPLKVEVTATVIKEITCNPNIGATIQVTPKNGIAPYTYTIEYLDDLGNSLPTPKIETSLTNLPAGKYKIVATDSKLCKSDAVTIEVKAKIDVSFDAKALCYDGSNGTINVTNILGNGALKYTQNGGTTLNAIPTGDDSFTIIGLSPGVHKIKIIDERGCSLEKTITIYPELSATATPTNLSCTPVGNPTGQILVVPSGGTGFVTPTDYQFSVVKANTTAPAAGTYSATNPITGLAAGTYDVYVKDAQNCEYIVEDILIKTITPIEITLTPNNPTCTTNGNVSGIITANTGQIEHTITLKDNAGVLIETIANHSLSTFNFNDIPAGTGYEVEITDSLGCTDTKTFDLVTPPVLAATLASILPDCDVPFVGNETLFGFKFENITAVASPYAIEYSKDNGITWETSPVFTSINQGIVVYPIIRLLENGVVKCTEKFNSYEIPFDVNGLIVDPIADPVNCALGFSVTVQAINGVGPFEFAINDITSPGAWQSADNLINTDKNGVVIDADRTLTYNGLTPGLSYVFYVRDSRGCIEKNSEDLYVDFNPTVPITGDVNNQTCATTDNGSITFSIDNNSSNLSNDFTWTLFKRDETTNLGAPVLPAYTNVAQTLFADITVNGLGEGKYYLEIENNIKTCIFGSQDVKIEPITPINGTFKKINDITCSVDGKVLIENVTGGLPATTGAAYTYKVINLVNATTATVTGSSITVAHTDVTDPALPVTFDIEIVDANPAPNSCTKTIGNVSLTVSESPTISSPVMVNSCGANKTIKIDVSNGTPPYSYSIDGGITFTAPTTDTTYTASGLVPANYDVVVKDVNGCEVSNATPITIHPSLDFGLEIAKNATCVPVNNGEVKIEITSGTGGNYTYSFDTGQTGTITAPATEIIQGSLSPGDYNVTVTDVTSNCSITKPIKVENPIDPTFTANITKNNSCNGANGGEITVTSTEALTYTINPAVAGSFNSTTNVFENLPVGEYEITATGTNGCTTPPNTIKIEEFDPIIVPAPTVANGGVTEFACTTGTNTRNSAIVKVPNSGTDLIKGGNGTYTKAEFVFTPNGGGAVVTPPASSSFEFTTDNVLGGTVDITVYDDKGCSGTTTAIIAAFTPIADLLATQKTAITCSVNESIKVEFTGTATEIKVVDANGINYDSTPATASASGTEFADLPVGKYTITIKNDTGCELTTSHTVKEIPAYTILLSDKIDTSCFGTASGSIEIDVKDYVGNYDYTITGATLVTAITGTGTGTIPVRTPKEITGLKAGNYTVNITIGAGTNPKNCTVTPIDFEIIDAPDGELKVKAEETSAVKCKDEANATITVTETKGGWGRYEYQLEDASGIVLGYDFTTNTTNKIFTGLSHGTYKVKVKDALGCISEDDITIKNPTQVEFTVTKDDTVCDVSKLAEIKVEASGGKAPYTYTLTDDASTPNVKTVTITDTEYTFTGLSKANYTVSVKDANQCIGTGTADIEIFDDIVFNEPTLVTGLKCQTNGVDNTDAVYNINVSGGSGTFTYLVTEKDDTSKVITVTPATLTTPPTFKTSVAEEYTITITDIGATPNCTKTSNFTVKESVKPEFEATATTTKICNGSSTGVITIDETVKFGINPVTYTISLKNGTLKTGEGTFKNSPKRFENLPAGFYTITGKGTNDCTFPYPYPYPDEIEIEQLDEVKIEANAIKDIEYSCNTTNPMATIKVDKNELSGGSGNYNVAFVYDNGTPADTTDDVTQAVPNVFEFTKTNTLGGEVIITVTDDQGCSSASVTKTIPAFAPILDLEIKKSDITKITCSANESIKVSFTGAINNITVTQTDVVTGGYVQNPATPVLTSPIEFTNLPTGNYTISVTDAVTGCEATRFHTVSKIPVYDVVLSDKKDIACFNGKGSIKIDVKDYTGNYDYEVVDSVTGIGLTSAIIGNGITAGTSEEITGLEAGKYKVKITLTGSPNCSVNLSAEFEIIKPAIILDVTADVTTKISCENEADGTITATATGGWKNYEYQLEYSSDLGITYNTAKDASSNDINFANNGSNNIFKNLPEGTYKVSVKDALGCVFESAEVEVKNPDAVTFTVSKDDTICNNAIGGEITVTGSGGTGTYTYTLTDDSNPVKVTTQTGVTGDYTFTNLPAAVYTVSVTDTNLCVGTEAPTNINPITINPDIEFSLKQTKNVDCSTSPNGEVTVTLVDWSTTSNYTYSVLSPLNPGSISGGNVTSKIFTIAIPSINTTPQTYTVIISENGSTCGISGEIPIAPKLEPSFEATPSDKICNGTETGVITITDEVFNGIKNVKYTISLNGGALTPAQGNFNTTTSSFENLPEGTYTITGTGDNKCPTSKKDVKIKQLDKVTIGANAIKDITYNCDVANPAATITVDKNEISGGNGDVNKNYNVEFVYDNGTPTDNTDDVTQIASSTFTFTTYNVLGGTVEIKVTDDQGCDSDIKTVTIPAFAPILPSDIQISHTPTCEVYKQSITVKLDNLDPTIITPIKVEIEKPDGTIISQETPRALANITGTVFSNLPVGIYTVSIKNPVTGCVTTAQSYSVEEPVYNVIYSSIENTTCTGSATGSVVIDVQKGNSQEFYTGEYEYEVLDSVGNSLTPSPIKANVQAATGTKNPLKISGLKAGSYVVKITDIDNATACSFTSEVFTIEDAPAGELKVTADISSEITCTNDNNATITATATGGWGSNYEYQLEDNLGNTITVKDALGADVIYDFANNKGNNIFKNLPEGTYKVQVKDVLGCDNVYSKEQIIVNPKPVTFKTEMIANICSDTKPAIKVTAKGGSGEYIYILKDKLGNEIESITTTSLTHTFDNLSVDNNEDYTVSVNDVKGCIGTPETVNADVVTVYPDIALGLTPGKLTCIPGSENAEYIINVTGGSGDFDYSVVDKNDATNIVAVIKTTNPPTFSIANAGTYILKIIDNKAETTCNSIESEDIVVDDKLVPAFEPQILVNNICNGSSTGEVLVKETPNGINPLEYSINTNPIITLPIGEFKFTGLSAGTYTITGKGTNGCTATKDVTIIEKSEITIDIDEILVTQFSCTTGNQTNMATVTVTDAINGGTVPGGVQNINRIVFVYDNGTPLDATDDIEQDENDLIFNIVNNNNDIKAGTVTITVYDAQNCSSATTTVAIDAFQKIAEAEIKITQKLDCTNKEIITVKANHDIANPNIANLIYTIKGTNTTYDEQETIVSATGIATFTGLDTDAYTITITNPATGCVFTTSHTVKDEPTFNIKIGGNKRTCFDATGIATATVTLDIETIIAAADYTGAYTYEVVDAITESSLTAPITGNGTGGVQNMISGLTAGTYKVKVTMTDTPGCEPLSKDFTIESQPELTLDDSIVTFISCNSGEGGIILKADGGWGNYEYQLEEATAGIVKPFSKNNKFEELEEGSYTATVRDINNCEATRSFVLVKGVKLIVNIFKVTQNVCQGEQNASIEVNVTGGGQTQDTSIRTYSYILKYPNGIVLEQTSNIFTGLQAGNYQVRVIDNKYGCTTGALENVKVEIKDPNKVIISSVNITEDITCNIPTASVEVTAGGGKAPYEFSTDGINYTASASTTYTFTGLNSGLNTFYVKDTEQCVTTTTATIAEYVPLKATLNVVSGFITCKNDSNGVLSATVTGGFGNYEYQLLNTAGVPITGIWQTSNTFSGLGVNTYKIKVKSINRFGEECFAVTDEHEIEEPEKLIPEVEVTQHVTCNGGNTGVITASAMGGTQYYEYNIYTIPSSAEYPANKFVQDGVFTNLKAGTYYVTVKDVRGCTQAPIKVTVKEPNVLEINPGTITQQVCIYDTTPTITVNVTGGTLPYYISINNEDEFEAPFDSSTNLITLGASEGIEAGKKYSISVRGKDEGCSVATLAIQETTAAISLDVEAFSNYTCDSGNFIKAFVADKYKDDVIFTLDNGINTPLTNTTGEFIDVAPGDGYKVTATHTASICTETSTDEFDIQDIQALAMTIDDSEKNKLIANVNFGLPPYNFTLDGVDYGQDNEFTILQTKEYEIKVTDARGCEVILLVTGRYVSISVLNLFTPDGDGINDFWYPLEVENYHNIKVYIYDRYARKIQNYQGLTQGWDGTYQGKPLPAGDYWYTIYYNELSGEEKKLMGHFTLYR